MAGTSAVYDPKVKPTTFNWWGSPGSSGNIIDGDPIKNWTKAKKKNRKK